MSDAAEDVFATIRAGARGYVTKSISGPDLADAVARPDIYDGAVAFGVDGVVSELQKHGGPDDVRLCWWVDV